MIVSRWLAKMASRARTASTDDARARIFAPNVSWRRMSISQPPLTRCDFNVNASGLYESGLSTFKISSGKPWARWFSCADAAGLNLGLGWGQFAVHRRRTLDYKRG